MWATYAFCSFASAIDDFFDGAAARRPDSIESNFSSLQFITVPPADAVAPRSVHRELSMWEAFPGADRALAPSLT